MCVGSTMSVGCRTTRGRAIDPTKRVVRVRACVRDGVRDNKRCTSIVSCVCVRVPKTRGIPLLDARTHTHTQTRTRIHGLRHNDVETERKMSSARKTSSSPSVSPPSAPVMTGRRIVVLARHGESEWSKNNVFCGWYDSLLSDRGTNEAQECAELLKQSNYEFDRAYTSLLTRAHQTLNIITEHIGQPSLPVDESWRLNERHYGALTGYNKAELAAKYGEKQVQIWRRSFNVLPPPMEATHQYYRAIWRNPKIVAESYTSNEKFPSTESLKETMERVIPYWDNFIVPNIERGQRILIVAHGTVLRSLIKYLEGVSDNDICSINIPSGIPFVYEFDDNMRVMSSRTFLGDKKRIEEGIARAASISSR